MVVGNLKSISREKVPGILHMFHTNDYTIKMSVSW